jgi:ParB-like chromosome segregation protein Spo0J
MTLQWIPLDQLQRHPENSNRMPPRLMEKLKSHIQRTGLYEPLVVRPVNCELPAQAGNPQCVYQILNGHHRAEVLRQLGHTHARCDVWPVNDADALVLLATLNRLEGRDDPAARARLVAKLAGGRSPEDLARLLPEPADAVARLLALAEPPPAPLAAEAAALAARPMTFFLTDEQHALVREALAEAARAPRLILQRRSSSCAVGLRTHRARIASGAGENAATRGGSGDPPRETCTSGAVVSAPGEYAGGEAAKIAPQPCGPPCIHGGPNKACSRAEAIERIALWYLQARNIR